MGYATMGGTWRCLEFPKIRGPNMGPKVVQGSYDKEPHEIDPQFTETAAGKCVSLATLS